MAIEPERNVNLVFCPPLPVVPSTSIGHTVTPKASIRTVPSAEEAFRFGCGTHVVAPCWLLGSSQRSIINAVHTSIFVAGAFLLCPLPAAVRGVSTNNSRAPLLP